MESITTILRLFFFTYRKYTNFFLLIVLFQSSVRYNRFTCDYLLSSRV